MNKYNLFYDKNTGQYFYQENENSEQIELNPLNKLDENDYNTWSWIDKNGNIYKLNQPQIDQGEITESNGESNRFHNYISKLKYDLANNKVPGGEYTLPAIGLAATSQYWLPYALRFTKDAAKYTLQHPVESFVMPNITNYGVNKAYDGYEYLTKDKVSQSTRNNTSLALNFIANPALMNNFRANVTSKFAPSPNNQFTEYFQKAMTNGEAGYVPIINNGINKSNLIRYGLTGTVGTGIALTKNSIEDNNTIGTEIFGDNLIGNTTDFALNSTLYGGVMRGINKPVSKIISNVNQSTGGAPTSDLAIQTATLNPSELLKMNGPAIIGKSKTGDGGFNLTKEYFAIRYDDPSIKNVSNQNALMDKVAQHAYKDPELAGMSFNQSRNYLQNKVKTFIKDNTHDAIISKDAGKSYQQEYELTPEQYKYNLRLHSYNAKPESNLNLYEETSSNKPLKIGQDLANKTLKVQNIITQDSNFKPKDSESFFAQQALETTGYKNRYGKGARVYVLTDHTSDKLPDYSTMIKEGWQAATKGEDGSITFQPLGGKHHYQGNIGDWTVGRNENGDYQKFNANGHTVLYLKSPEGQKYSVQIDFGGSGSASGKGSFAKDVSQSGQHPIITVHVKKRNISLVSDKETDKYGNNSESNFKMAAENILTNLKEKYPFLAKLQEAKNLNGIIEKNNRATAHARYETDENGYIKRQKVKHVAVKDTKSHKEGDEYYTEDKILTPGYKQYKEKQIKAKKDSNSKHEEIFYSDVPKAAKQFAKMRPNRENKYSNANKAKINKLDEKTRNEYLEKGYIHAEWLKQGGELTQFLQEENLL